MSWPTITWARTFFDASEGSFGVSPAAVASIAVICTADRRSLLHDGTLPHRIGGDGVEIGFWIADRLRPVTVGGEQAQIDFLHQILGIPGMCGTPQKITVERCALFLEQAQQTLGCLRIHYISVRDGLRPPVSEAAGRQAR